MGAVTSLKGRLLVANPAMPDPNFHRAVVLVLAHQEDGALGVVLNRPSDLDVDAPLPRWERLVADPPVVFVGGPVAPGAAICLARRGGGRLDNGTGPAGPADPADPAGGGGWIPLVGELGTLDLEGDPDDLAITVDAIRVFAGYAGWGPGQLEAEREAGAWFVVPVEPDDAVSGDPGQLWKRVLRRQGGRLAVVAAYPNEPNLN
ncbi:MAG: YqgE/AlgH family protein [Actinomycetota bacterium]|nr:YqgE/AlgH family protein [Actinomycetota bacterium]